MRIRLLLMGLAAFPAVVPAMAQAPVVPQVSREIAPPYPMGDQIVRFNFTGDAGSSQIESRIALHKKQCEEIGLPDCKVTTLSMNDRNGPNGVLNLLIARERAEAFIQQLVDVPLEQGISVEVNAPKNPQIQSMEDKAVERRLLDTQRDTLQDILETEDPAMRVAARQQLSAIDSQLQRLDAELVEAAGRQGEMSGGITLQITYNAQDYGQRDKWGQAMEEALLMFLYSLAAVFGIAILSAVYFGILAAAFLGFRKFWRRRWRTEENSREVNVA